MFFRPFNHYECDACLRVRRSEQNDVSSEASCMIYGTFAPSSLIGDLFEPDHQLEVVGAYKSLTTVAWIRYSKAPHMDSIGPFWLRNYFDRVIRNNDELERARLYIRNNPHKLATREW